MKSSSVFTWAEAGDFLIAPCFAWLWLLFFSYRSYLGGELHLQVVRGKVRGKGQKDLTSRRDCSCHRSPPTGQLLACHPPPGKSGENAKRRNVNKTHLVYQLHQATLHSSTGGMESLKHWPILKNQLNYWASKFGSTLNKPLDVQGQVWARRASRRRRPCSAGSPPGPPSPSQPALAACLQKAASQMEKCVIWFRFKTGCDHTQFVLNHAPQKIHMRCAQQYVTVRQSASVVWAHRLRN